MSQDEKKATEDLLAGFDRPGRSPRAPRVQSKFIDFTGTPVEAAPVDARRAEDTALITRARRAGLLPWIAVVLVITLSCVTVAWLAIGTRSAPPLRAAPIAPVVAPVTAEPPPPVPTVASPPPVAPVVAPPIRSVAPRPSAPSPGDPRVDFVRNL